MGTKRIKEIDMLRGIGIIYMILGHINFGVEFDHYIHAFHMPFFFFIAGLFFKRKNLSFFSFFRKITRQLLLPYFFWGIFFCFLAYFMKVGVGNYSKSLINLFTINNSNLAIAGALWYLTCFYFCQLIIYVLNKYLKKEIFFGIGCISSMLIGFILSKFNVVLWWSIVPSFVGVGIIYLGYIFKKTNLIEKIKQINFVFIVFIFILNIYLIMNTGYVNMRIGLYPNYLMFFINLIMSVICYLNFSNVIIGIKKLNFLNSKICYLGEYSIVPLCINQFIILFFNYILNKFNLYLTVLNLLNDSILLFNILYSLFIILIIYILTRVFIETKLRILFGK